jgi:hypothetical protein
MCSLESIIKMYAKDIKWDVVERILLVSVGTSACLFLSRVMNLRFQWDVWKFFLQSNELTDSQESLCYRQLVGWNLICSGQVLQCCNNEMEYNGGQNTTSLLAGYSFGVNKQHVSAYSEAIIRFTNVSYRRLITMRGYVVRCWYLII